LSQEDSNDSDQTLSDDAELAHRHGAESALVSARSFESQQAISAGDILVENALLRFALEFMPVGFCLFDKHDRLQLCNQQYLDIWSLPLHLAQRGTNYNDIFAQSHGTELKVARSKPLGTHGENRREFLTENRNVIEVHVHLLPDGAVVALHEDVTERRRDEAQIAYFASHDTLTSLANRVTLYETLTDALSKDSQPEIALIYIDLDKFKNINDTYGHPAGDILLQKIAERLRDCCRESDLIARLGGDEFAIVVADLSKADYASRLSRRIIESLSKPVEIYNTSVQVSASIGISLSPIDGKNSDELSRKADMALYQAKADGRGRFCFFDPCMEAEARARLTLESDLKQAIKNGEFELFYQPQFRLDTMTLSGAEALIRWNHPTRGRVPPDDFIPLAEETGLIVDIGRWVMNTACQEAVNWPAEITVAVNISAVQFQQATLLEDITTALVASKLHPQRLEVEITETAAMEYGSDSIDQLHRLKAEGVLIAIDDFGTGYSSLQHLHIFPIDKIKIDRSFVFNIETSPNALSIVRAVTSLANSFNISTIAEGVETPAQLELIRQEGCDEVQGYLLGKPCSAADFHKKVQESVLEYRKIIGLPHLSKQVR